MLSEMGFSFFFTWTTSNYLNFRSNVQSRFFCPTLTVITLQWRADGPEHLYHLRTRHGVWNIQCQINVSDNNHTKPVDKSLSAVSKIQIIFKEIKTYLVKKNFFNLSSMGNSKCVCLK